MFNEIKTARLLLRPLTIDDLDYVHAYSSDKDNTTFMYFLPFTSKEETSEFLTKITKHWKREKPVFYAFAITLDGKVIGDISILMNENRTEGELGWILDKSYWKQGYALEAALAMKEFAFKELNIPKLTACCDYRNKASYQLMEKIGLRLESDTGTRTYPKNGETAKELKYSLISDEA